jgi:hypothetical protein
MLFAFAVAAILTGRRRNESSAISDQGESGFVEGFASSPRRNVRFGSKEALMTQETKQRKTVSA